MYNLNHSPLIITLHVDIYTIVSHDYTTCYYTSYFPIDVWQVISDTKDTMFANYELFAIKQSSMDHMQLQSTCPTPTATTANLLQHKRHSMLVFIEC